MEAFKAAPSSLTDRGLAEYLLARFDVAEKDAEKPKQTIPAQPGHRFKAKTEQGPVAWEFVTLVNDKIICVDERDMTGQVWDRVPFEAAFTVTEVLS